MGELPGNVDKTPSVSEKKQLITKSHNLAPKTP
jgi:hypothetical protein